MSGSQEMSGTHDCGGDAAAYLLGALEPAEAQEFERHLEECVACRDAVEALQGVIKALPMAAPQHSAPRRLRRRVMQAIRAEPKPGMRQQRRRRATSSWPRSRAALAALSAAAVVALAIFGGVELSGTSGSRVIRARLMGVSGSAQLQLVGSHRDLSVHHLSPPPPGHVYEVWLKAPHAAPVPAGVLFRVTSGGAADFGLPGSLRGISEVMVTPEPDGGSLAPTHSPVIVAQLS